MLKTLILRGALYVAFSFLAELALALLISLLALNTFSGLTFVGTLKTIAGVVGALGIFMFISGGVVGRVHSHAGIPWFAPKATRRIVDAAENLRLKELMSLSERAGGIIGSLALITFALAI